jgi:adenine deaminase
MNLDLRRCVLVSDGLAPKTLIKGYMNRIVQKAIELGFPPVKAIQMVTLNPAEHLRLDHLIGGIAPYRYADVVVTPDIKRIVPEFVVSNGSVVLREGSVVAECRIPSYLKSRFSSINLPSIKPTDFSISCKDKDIERIKARVIYLISPLVTKEKVYEFVVKNGQVEADPQKDILKVAALTEVDGQVKKFVGFVKGFGLKKGAIATSAVWDACLTLVVGANDTDMAEAVNRVVNIGGGIAVSKDGKIVSELSMPIGGIMSELPLNEIAEKMSGIQREAESLGCTVPDVHLSLSVLTTPYIPFLRLSEDGLFDLKEWKKLDLFIR